ncbi:MAG: SRPBCC family protein [Desulfocapsaceae bacterium]|nr:SRPBCC family protein [Desulfocapsaceae bacterium]
MYTLRLDQFLTTSLEKAWAFLENPYNLNRITPADLHFEITSDAPEVMHDGLIIEYLITIPVIGRQRWITEIKHIQKMHSFVDEQRLGPYRFWYHLHQIKEEANGVRSFDTVYYKPPYGIAGHLLNRLFISKTLNRIFDYRQTRLAEIFGD